MGRSLKKTKQTKKGLGILHHAVYGSWLLILAYLIIGHTLPYSFYANVKEITISDVCVGSDVTTYNSERTPLWDMPGESYSEIVKFSNQEKIETTIKRGSRTNPIAWNYEADTTTVVFQARWSEPFIKSGTYGIASWDTIYPLPFISVSQFTPAEELTFNVIVCE